MASTFSWVEVWKEAWFNEKCSPLFLVISKTQMQHRLVRRVFHNGHIALLHLEIIFYWIVSKFAFSRLP